MTLYVIGVGSLGDFLTAAGSEGFSHPPDMARAAAYAACSGSAALARQGGIRRWNMKFVPWPTAG